MTLRRNKPLRAYAPLRRTGKLKSKRRGIPATVRQAVLLRAGGRCEVCGLPVDYPEMHHTLPRSRGGRDHPDDLLATHSRCHRWCHDNPQKATERGWLRSGYADNAS